LKNFHPILKLPLYNFTSDILSSNGFRIKFIMALSFHYLNFPPNAPHPVPDANGTFTLHAPAPTDIWRKPPSHDVLNAPIIYKSLPISKFKRARITAIGEWKTLYDQGGLVLVFPSAKNSSGKPHWIKTGIEFYNERPCMSVVAASEWADWSLLPLNSADEKAGKMTVEVEREQEKGGEWGSVLKIYLLDGEGSSKMPIREITWVFHGLDEREEMWVGVFAAKPTSDERGELVVRLEEFDIEERD
jgi:regulation of enolase protein 1 (concanavalin A-like superfamily)